MVTLSAMGIFLWTVGLVALGAAAGYLWAGVRAREASGGRPPAELKRDYDQYRGKVDAHFATTNELLQRMTEQYREVYAHMASGARELCEVEPARLADHLSLEDRSAILPESVAAAAVAPAAFDDGDEVDPSDAADPAAASGGEAAAEAAERVADADAESAATDDDYPSLSLSDLDEDAGAVSDESGMDDTVAGDEADMEDTVAAAHAEQERDEEDDGSSPDRVGKAA